MAKKPLKKRPSPSPLPPILSASSDEESPPPVKISAGSTATVLRKHSDPSLKPADGVKEKEIKESSVREEAEESSEDSGKAAPKRNRRAERRVSRNTDDANKLKLEKPSAATKTLAKTVSMAEKSKEIDESSESKEKESTDDEPSEDSRDATRQSNPLTQKRDSPQPVINSANPIADPSLKPPNFSKSVDGEEKEEDSVSEEEGNMPIDSSAQPVVKEPNSGKQSTASHARISKKKRTACIVGAEGAQEKERFKRIWSNEDEMALLQGILEYKERHLVIPYALVHAVSLLKSVKDSLSISVSVNQINDKVRRMKKRYINTAARKNLAKRSKFSDPHNAAAFYLSKKIWDSVKEESIFPENEIMLEKKVEKFKKRKKESRLFAAEYPSLYWLLRSEHANNALVLQNHIPIENATKLDEKCKELEMIDIQLNMQKIEFLSSAVKLIKEALAKC